MSITWDGPRNPPAGVPGGARPRATSEARGRATCRHCGPHCDGSDLWHGDEERDMASELRDAKRDRYEDRRKW